MRVRISARGTATLDREARDALGNPRRVTLLLGDGVLGFCAADPYAPGARAVGKQGNVSIPRRLRNEELELPAETSDYLPAFDPAGVLVVDLQQPTPIPRRRRRKF